MFYVCSPTLRFALLGIPCLQFPPDVAPWRVVLCSPILALQLCCGSHSARCSSCACAMLLRKFLQKDVAARCMPAAKKLRGARLFSTSAPKDNMMQTVVGFPKRHPFVTNMLIVTGLTPLADYQVQRAENKGYDPSRSAAFVAFGVYQGIMQWLFYVTLMSRMFPGAVAFANMPLADKMRNRSGAWQLVGQMVVDLLVFIPIVYYPVFYTFRGYFNGDSMETSLRRYAQNFVVDNGISVGFWIPGDILCFAAPMWMRLPISHTTGFAWNALLSWLRGAVNDTSEIRHTDLAVDRVAGIVEQTAETIKETAETIKVKPSNLTMCQPAPPKVTSEHEATK